MPIYAGQKKPLGSPGTQEQHIFTQPKTFEKGKAPRQPRRYETSFLIPRRVEPTRADFTPSSKFPKVVIIFMSVTAAASDDLDASLDQVRHAEIFDARVGGAKERGKTATPR